MTCLFCVMCTGEDLGPGTWSSIEGSLSSNRTLSAIFPPLHCRYSYKLSLRRQLPCSTLSRDRTLKAKNARQTF